MSTTSKIQSSQDSSLLFTLRSMSVYRTLLEDRAVRSLVRLLDGGGLPPLDAAASYGELLETLQMSGLSLCDYIYSVVLYDENVFTRLAARGLPAGEGLLCAVRHDLRALSGLAYLQPGEVKERMHQRYPAFAAEIDALPEFPIGHTHYLADESDWGNEIDALREFCRENGCGDQARRTLLLGAAVR